MTKIEAIETLKEFMPGSGFCVVRWNTRFRLPAWTIETVNHAEKEIKEFGLDYCRIEARN